MHESRLTVLLRELLLSMRVAALGTIGKDGAPFVSMVPYAIDAGTGCLVLHVSGLAAHTGNMRERPQVSVLVMQSETPGEPVHALQRVSLEGRAEALEPDTPVWQDCCAAYLTRFPEAAPMTQLGDFIFVAIRINGARQIAGFGAARSMEAAEVRQALMA